MGGQGSFCDTRINVCVSDSPDLVAPKLPALLEYQLSLQKPPPPPGSFDTVAAARGKALFEGACASCHSGAAYTDAPALHDAAETGMDPAHAQRSATKKYRSTPLRALWQHAPYFHDGSASDLPAVVNHYDGQFSLGLTEAQKSDLVEYLKSL
jgi:cytochrome c peroxidase